MPSTNHIAIAVLVGINIVFLLSSNFTSSLNDLNCIQGTFTYQLDTMVGTTTSASSPWSTTTPSNQSYGTTGSASYHYYQPSAVEQFVLDNGRGSLQLDGVTNKTLGDGCRIWKDPQASPYYQALKQYRMELNHYNRLLEAFDTPIPDLRLHLDHDDHKVCETLELVPGGLAQIFQSGVLSRLGGNGKNGTSGGGTSGGYVEPLLPPMRHPAVCSASIGLNGRLPNDVVMNMGYLVQDFESLCQKLHRHSRTVFVDMGAALDFHNKKGGMQPAMYITHMYQKFGFHFDHIYAYELKEKNPAKVYSQIPNELRSAYHWFNVGVSSDPESPNNPLTMLLEHFNEDDFIVVKLDIDTGFIENPLARSILEDERFHKLIDCFYFEHHVMLKELAPNWVNSMDGSVIESLKMFSEMRERGIASHYWP